MTSNSFLSAVGSVASVTLVVAATRWLLGAKGAQVPRIRDGVSLYGIKWQWRATGLAGAIVGIVLAIWSWHDQHHPDWTAIAIAVAFVAMGLWLASGSITTNRTGITKTALGGRALFVGVTSRKFDCIRSRAELSSCVLARKSW